MQTHTSSVDINDDWWELAQKVLPGGVNAAARINRVLNRAFLASRGQGGIIVDHLGREYIDVNMSYGASLLGFGHPAIRDAVENAREEGFLCGYETVHQIALAKELTRLVPSAEMVRFCTTGTETTWHAIRLARAYTGKSVVVKFEGHFHGYNDYLGYSAWPSLDALPLTVIPYPETAGMPSTVQELVIVAPFNDLEAITDLFETRHGEIAALILEPVCYNSGTILPRPGFLEGIRELASKYNIVLIFDEILSGFRTGLDCMQGYFGVTPDLTTLGKALGGGLALSALVGKREIMGMIAPSGPVRHSGTYIAHPVEVQASAAFISVASKPDFYPELLRRCERLHAELQSIFRRAGLRIKVQGLGARFSLLFGISEEQAVTNYRDLATLDQMLAHKFYSLALDEGVYFNPGWHHGISSAHTDAQLNEVLHVVEHISQKLRTK